MDPNVALEYLVSLVSCFPIDDDEVAMVARDLADWTSKGGFVPELAGTPKGAYVWNEYVLPLVSF